MNLELDRPTPLQRGMVLITTLLLLLVVTILALAMFRGVGLENRIAGNVLDKQRALQSAESAQQYAQQWLIANVQSMPTIDCSANPAATTTSPQICSEPLSMQISSGPVSTVPWKIGNVAVGVSYNPNNVIQASQSGGQNTLYGLPVAYIGELGRDATYANATDYIVDAWSYGGSEATVAVVESTYQVRYSVASATSP